MSTQDLSTQDLSTLDDETLMRMEREIARKYMGGISIPMVLWPFINVSVWFSLWYFVFTGMLSVWAAFPIAVLNATLAYLPSHDAQHDIYARPGEPLRWLNEFIGHFSVIPIAYSYKVLRVTHLEHHKHTNDSAFDPDFHAASAGSMWQSVLQTIETFQPGSKMINVYGDTLDRLNTPEAKEAKRDGVIITLSHFAILFICAAYGYALEAALLWWLPIKLGTIYLRLYLSWMPHQPANTKGRYGNTNGFKSWLGAWSSLGMTAHIVHHLHPRIALDRTPAALHELKPILIARGCKVE